MIAGGCGFSGVGVHSDRHALSRAPGFSAFRFLKGILIPMYLAHYQLSREPFNVGADPAFLWLGDKNRRIFDSLGKGVLEPKGCVVLCGDVGSGKTTLVNYLASLDGMTAVTVALHESALEALDFCNLLALELRMDRSFDSRDEFHSALSSFLARNYGSYRRLLLVVEEAQRAGRKVFEELGTLSRLAVGRRNLLKIVLVGNPRLEAVLETEAQHGEGMPIAAFCRLEPLSEEDTRRYIEHRLKLAGAKRKLFSPAAIKSIFSLSKGCPRLINMVCDHALLCGYGSHLDAIGEQVILECSRDLAVALDIDEAPKIEYTVGMIKAPAVERNEPARVEGPRHMRGLLILAAAIGVVGAVLYFLLR